jgi:hypothetical protein
MVPAILLDKTMLSSDQTPCATKILQKKGTKLKIIIKSLFG